MTPLDLCPRPDELAAAWLPPGCEVTLNGVPVTLPDEELSWYVSVAGAALPTPGRLWWHHSRYGLLPPPSEGGAVLEAASRRLARAARRREPRPLALYLACNDHDGWEQPLACAAVKIRRRG